MMFELPLSYALAIYSAVLGVLALGIWLYTELSVRRPQRKLGQQFVWRCTFCGCSYLDELAESLSQCPRCENFNTAEEAAVAGTNKPPAPMVDTREPDENRKNTSKRKRPNQRTRGPRRRR